MSSDAMLQHQAPEAILLVVSKSQIGNIGVVRCNAAEINYVSGERRTFCKVARRMLVAARASGIEGEVDHGAQHDRCSDRVLLRECLRCRRHKFVKVAVKFDPSPTDKLGSLRR
ncbi:hypothetical protein D9M72_583490 [compost metagenome]